MFTSVDSNRKKLEHPSNENVQFPQSLNNSIIKESKSGIANQIDHFLGFTFGFSIFIGAIAGIFYLRLLAKSIGKLGKESSGVSKLQLLVPVCLFIFASKLGSLDIFPAMIGFFIYKPSLILYFSRS